MSQHQSNAIDSKNFVADILADIEVDKVADMVDKINIDINIDIDMEIQFGERVRQQCCLDSVTELGCY